jgi:hypothetical protein
MFGNSAAAAEDGGGDSDGQMDKVMKGASLGVVGAVGAVGAVADIVVSQGGAVRSVRQVFMQCWLSMVETVPLYLITRHASAWDNVLLSSTSPRPSLWPVNPSAAVQRAGDEGINALGVAASGGLDESTSSDGDIDQGDGEHIHAIFDTEAFVSSQPLPLQSLVAELVLTRAFVDLIRRHVLGMGIWT